MKIRNYINKSLDGMAQGLFSSLIIGLILKQLGLLFGLEVFIKFGNIAQRMMGPAIGVGVAHSLGAPRLGILSNIVTASIGASTISLGPGGEVLAGIGEPVGAYIAALVGTEVSKLVEREGSLDIIMIPSLTIIIGGLTGTYISPILSEIMKNIGSLINTMTTMHPLPMGILISVVMGMLLTLPISSAALAISLNLSGLAAGAATVGCCANMIGFAIISFRDNGLGGLIAQGLGTSMLQISNIFKKPLIWLPSILTSALLGPISTVILKLESNPIGAGMGTSGLVGQIAMVETMGYSKKLLIQIIVLHILLPALLSYFIASYLRARGYIKKGDMQI